MSVEQNKSAVRKMIVAFGDYSRDFDNLLAPKNTNSWAISARTDLWELIGIIDNAYSRHIRHFTEWGADCGYPQLDEGAIHEYSMLTCPYIFCISMLSHICRIRSLNLTRMSLPSTGLRYFVIHTTWYLISYTLCEVFL